MPAQKKCTQRAIANRPSTDKDATKRRIVPLFFRRGGFFLETRRDDRMQERHHGAKLRAELLDGMALLPLARRQEIWATRFVFGDPFFRKTAVADFREYLAHFFARLFGNDTRAGRVIAMLRRVADRITHVA